MQKYVIALYIRLSIEDYKYDSLSIENQSLVLHEYAASMPEALNAEIMEFIDNGYSGTNFERPQIQKLIELVRANQIDCIIVKDFSRFGRNSIETSYFIERVFPLFHTRFISISDDFDSSKFKGDTGGMDVAFKYLISEYYSRDMSIKTKSAMFGFAFSIAPTTRIRRIFPQSGDTDTAIQSAEGYHFFCEQNLSQSYHSY